MNTFFIEHLWWLLNHVISPCAHNFFIFLFSGLSRNQTERKCYRYKSYLKIRFFTAALLHFNAYTHEKATCFYRCLFEQKYIFIRLFIIRIGQNKNTKCDINHTELKEGAHPLSFSLSFFLFPIFYLEFTKLKNVFILAFRHSSFSLIIWNFYNL